MIGGGTLPRIRSSARRSAGALIRYTIVSRQPTPSRDDATIIDVTWIWRQYELGAGTGAAGPTKKNETPRAIVSTAMPYTTPPIVRTFARPSISHRYPSTTRNVISEEYSYMLPHGVRPAAMPRVTIDTPLATNPTTPITVATVWSRSLRNARYANDVTIAAM